jgi:DNA-binding NtrC family response regulator
MRAIVRGVLRRVTVMVNCLLIDKNPRDRSSMLQILNGLGLKCEERSGAAEAIQFCNERHPDVVVMEASKLNDTKEFLRFIKFHGATHNRPVVILYSEMADISAMGETILQGASDFMMMPITPDLLQFKLAQAGVSVH